MELESLSADYLSLISGGAGGAGGGAPPFSDITFCVEGQHVPAHRCILAARSHFFKLMFSHHFDPSSLSHPPLPTSPLLRPPPSAVLPHLFVPLDVVGFDVFVTLLRFLYSGQLILSPPLSPSSVSSPCALPSCPHSSCSYAIDLLLQLIPAAHFFGVPQLADVVQTRLGSVLEEGVSMESWMKVLVMAKKHKMQHVWHVCADFVINSGLDCDVMRRFLPREVIAELAETRLQRSGCMQNNVQIYDHVQPPQQNLSNSLSSCGIMCSINAGSCCSDEQKILRLQQALDCMDVELVRLMVMGEGLNLDKALALHYSVANCNREVVKALLELGVVDVNYSDSLGRTALHLAADMGNAEMIAVLLDHHADPNVLTHDGFAAVDILRGLIKATGQDHFHHDQQPVIMPPLCKADQKRIHLCIELLQSAAAVAGREEPAESSCVTQAAAQIFSTNLNQDAPAFMSCGPGVLLAGGMPVSCGLRLTEGSEAAVPIIRNHDRVRSTANGTRSSPFDAVSCPLHLLGDGMQSISAPQLARGSSSIGSISAAVRIDKVKHATSISSSELNHFNNHAQMTAQIQHMNVISGETRSVISPRVVSHNVNHGNVIYQGSAGYPGGYEDMQSTAITESGSTNRAAAQDGQPMNAGTGSSSEE